MVMTLSMANKPVRELTSRCYLENLLATNSDVCKDRYFEIRIAQNGYTQSPTFLYRSIFDGELLRTFYIHTKNARTFL